MGILVLRSFGGGNVWTDGRTYGCLDINPCVLQDIGPLGPLPKKIETKEIKVAKALDGQRYPLPLCECMWV